MSLAITEAELQLMRIIWAEQPLTSRQMIDRACHVLHWKEGTVKSLISRLVQKEVLHKDESVSPFLFRANIGQSKVITALLDTNLSTTCAMRRVDYLAHLIQSQPLSQQDCQQLITLLQTTLHTAPSSISCTCPIGQCACHLEKGV